MDLAIHNYRWLVHSVHLLQDALDHKLMSATYGIYCISFTDSPVESYSWMRYGNTLVLHLTYKGGVYMQNVDSSCSWCDHARPVSYYVFKCLPQFTGGCLIYMWDICKTIKQNSLHPKKEKGLLGLSDLRTTQLNCASEAHQKENTVQTV